MAAPAPTLSLEEEMQRYLAAVDVFRKEGCPVTWRPEWNVPLMRPHCENCGQETPWPQRFCDRCQQ